MFNIFTILSFFEIKLQRRALLFLWKHVLEDRFLWADRYVFFMVCSVFFYQRTWQIKRVYNSYFLIIPEIKVDLKKKQLLYCILTLKQKWRNWQQKKNKKNEYLNNKTICKFWYLLIANIIKTTFNASLLLWGVGKKLNEWRDYND